MGFWAFDSLSRWVAHTLEQHLASQRHLLRDSFDFATRVRGHPLPPESALHRIDLKHFFMSGTPSELAELSTQIIPDGRLRTLVHDAILWLLQNQFVQKGTLLRRVIRGSGVGLAHSSAVADADFWALGDRWILQVDLQSKFGVQSYCRFRNIFYICRASGSQTLCAWLCAMYTCI